MRLIAGTHYDVSTVDGGWRRGQIRALTCRFCLFSVDVIALHRTGDRSGAPRYCRARNAMVKHIHAEHREAANV